MFRGLADLAGLVKQTQQIGSRTQELGEQLRSRRVSGSAGGGLVDVEVNGQCELLSCRVDPTLLAQQDRELLEDLIVGAVNQALAKARQLHAEALQGMLGGMNLPGLDQALSQLNAGGPGGSQSPPG